MPTVQERLAVVETEIGTLRSDVSEVKGDVREVKADVKSLLLAKAAQSGGWSVVVKSIPFVALLLSIAVALRG